MRSLTCAKKPTRSRLRNTVSATNCRRWLSVLLSWLTTTHGDTTAGRPGSRVMHGACCHWTRPSPNASLIGVRNQLPPPMSTKLLSSCDWNPCQPVDRQRRQLGGKDIFMSNSQIPYQPLAPARGEWNNVTTDSFFTDLQVAFYFPTLLAYHHHHHHYRHFI